MAIPSGHRANFDTLMQAARDGNLALMECRDAVTLELSRASLRSAKAMPATCASRSMPGGTFCTVIATLVPSDAGGEAADV